MHVDLSNILYTPHCIYFRMASSPLKIAVPTKKIRLSNDFNKCIICQKGKMNTLRKASNSGKKSFLKALRIRQSGDDLGVYPRIAHVLTEDADGEEWIFLNETELFWHKTCFSSFTSSSNLKYMMVNEAPEDLQDDASTATTMTRSSTNQIDLKNVCFFCDKKSHNKDRTLVKVATPEFCKTLEKKVDELDDYSLRCKVGDISKLIANDACYHKACHSKYLKRKPEKTNVTTIYDQAFDDLLLVLQPKLKEGRAVDMNTVLDWYKECLQRYTDEDISGYRKQKLKEKIEKKCSNQMKVYPVPGNKPDIVVSTDLQLQDAINVAATLKDALKEAGSCDLKINDEPSFSSASRILYYAALLLKSAVKNATSLNIQPLDLDNLALQHWNKQVPDDLYNFFLWVIGDEVNVSETSNRVPEEEQLHRQVLSLAQDLIYVRSKGRVKTPKHVAVGVSLHQMTQSRELVTLVNKLGHSVSYQEVQRIDTCWTDMQKSLGQSTVPVNMVPGRVTRAAGDNFNRSTEALEGQHHDVVNMVLYQNDGPIESSPTAGGTFGEISPTSAASDSTSCTEETGTILMCPNISGKNAGPHHLVGKPNLDWFFQCSSAHQKMVQIDI